MSQPVLPPLPRCREQVYHSGDSWFRGSPCARKPVRDGYCTQHHPDTVKARREAAAAKYRAKSAARTAAHNAASLTRCSDEQLLAEVQRRRLKP